MPTKCVSALRPKVECINLVAFKVTKGGGGYVANTVLWRHMCVEQVHNR